MPSLPVASAVPPIPALAAMTVPPAPGIAAVAPPAAAPRRWILVVLAVGVLVVLAAAVAAGWFLWGHR
jgi:hypothetical protein